MYCTAQDDVLVLTENSQWFVGSPIFLWHTRILFVIQLEGRV